MTLETALYQQILYSVEDPIATVTMNRPDRLNAMTPAMESEIKHAIARAEADPAVVAIVLTGAGRGFCAGADLKNLQAIGEGKGFGEGSGLTSDPGDPAMGANFRGPWSYMFSVRKPIVAALNGPTAGLGFAAALFADVRFASDRATFTTAFVRRGLIAEWGMSWTLPRLVGSANALDVLWSGRVFDAAEALRMGLVNRVLPHDELVPFVRSWAEELAANCSPASIAVIKRQLYASLTSELGPALDESIRLMHESFGRPDFKEGVSSFLEKRPPKFGRLSF
jgi:enoyl-CoA hydratase/carnithine racemase